MKIVEIVIIIITGILKVVFAYIDKPLNLPNN
jgi:hypothetical protein